MNITENTLSRAVEATQLFTVLEGDNRRRSRSSEPTKAVDYQFKRIYDVVGSEALVLCDSRGRDLASVGNKQLCRLLSHSTPTLYSRSNDHLRVQMKGLDIIRPGIDPSNISLSGISLPAHNRKLFVASISESKFNEAGVLHATNGVSRILGIGHPYRGVTVSSRDRLIYDVSRSVSRGYYRFLKGALCRALSEKRWFTGFGAKSVYKRALSAILERSSRRLSREGLIIEQPSFWRGMTGHYTPLSAGYRQQQWLLPVKIIATGRSWGLLRVEMVMNDNHFHIPSPPMGDLECAN
jgi:hypothetical protein